MYFQNGNLKFDIIDLNVNVKKKGDSDAYEETLYVNRTSKDFDVSEFINDFDGSVPIIIATDSNIGRSYTFEGFHFDGISRFITEETDRLNLNFAKIL